MIVVITESISTFGIVDRSGIAAGAATVLS